MAGDLPPEAFAAALAALPGAGPGRLRRLLAGRHPVEAWELVRAGRAGRSAASDRTSTEAAAVLDARWQRASWSIHPAALWERCRQGGVTVHVGPSAVFAGDPDPPAVWFTRGAWPPASGPAVAVVGTRSCTALGRAVAADLGRELAAAGVVVVSGLAAGIDGAAHAGALDAAGGAPPLAVVGSGPDVPYPRRHAALWERVCRSGTLLSEAPPGAPAEAWRFPVRNRLVAALADVVVVVESGRAGGSMHTVEHAQRRDRPVLAVPGSVRSPASEGTNELLHQGCGPARDHLDVLVALGLVAHCGSRPTVPAEVRPKPDGVDAAVLEALGDRPCTADQLVLRAGHPLAEVALAVDRLERKGWLVRSGGWIEPLPVPGGGR